LRLDMNFQGSWQYLPHSLKSLSFRSQSTDTSPDTMVPSLQYLPMNLQTLSLISLFSYIEDVNYLPISLTRLTLCTERTLPILDHLPSSLQDLYIHAPQITGDLRSLPLSLQKLTIERSVISDSCIDMQHVREVKIFNMNISQGCFQKGFIHIKCGHLRYVMNGFTWPCLDLAECINYLQLKWPRQKSYTVMLQYRHLPYIKWPTDLDFEPTVFKAPMKLNTPTFCLELDFGELRWTLRNICLLHKI
jgi:hypothetical protein